MSRSLSHPVSVSRSDVGNRDSTGPNLPLPELSAASCTQLQREFMIDSMEFRAPFDNKERRKNSGDGVPSGIKAVLKLIESCSSDGETSLLTVEEIAAELQFEWNRVARSISWAIENKLLSIGLKKGLLQKTYRINWERVSQFIPARKKRIASDPSTLRDFKRKIPAHLMGIGSGPSADGGGSTARRRVPWVSLIEMYLFRLRTKRPSQMYYENVRRTLLRFTDYLDFWNASVDAITQFDIQTYVNQRSSEEGGLPKSKKPKKRISEYTINNEIAALNGIFQFAGPRANYRGHRDNLGIISNPPYCDRLKQKELSPVAITNEQISSFLKATEIASVPRPSVCDPKLFWRAVLVLDSITAVRRGALLALLRPDDHTLLVKKQLVMTADAAKNRRSEVITLGTRDDVVKLLASLPSKPGEPLLPWKWPNGKPLSLNHFSRAMKDFQLKAGIEPGDSIKTKHLRSTAATEILAEQFSTDTARKRLGHKSEGVIQRHYQARTVTQSDRRASDLLAKRVMDMMDGNSPGDEPKQDN